MIRNLLCVALGGAIGAMSRYLVIDGVHRRWPSAFPAGTLVVNVTGCLLIGFLVQASAALSISPATRLLLITGLLGALTTFSTFGYDTLLCLDKYGWKLAATNIAANVVSPANSFANLAPRRVTFRTGGLIAGAR